MTFIELTGPSGHAVFLQPDDVKLVKHHLARGLELDTTLILLYGAEAVWVEVTETPEEVMATIQEALAPAKYVLSTFPGRD